MRDTSVLEFTLFSDVYCFAANIVEYVFELESYNKLDGLHEAVVGVTKYNNDIIMLVDTIKLYSGKDNDFSKTKSVIVVKKKTNSILV